MSIQFGSRCGASLVVLALLLAPIATTPPAWAVNFTRIGEGSLQHLNNYVASSEGCLNHASSTNWATNGRITAVGGTLNWSGLGKLDVDARIVQVNQQGVPTPCYDSWRAMNAEDFTLDFIMEGGDPAAFLRITPRLVGSITQITGTGGHPSTSNLTVDMRMTIRVNGEIVSQDQLYLVSDQTTGQSATFPLNFPKANLNTVVIPGAAATGNEISVSLFAYSRVIATGTISVLGSSPTGNDVGIYVTAEPVGPVGVAEEEGPPALSLGVRPNPSVAAPRISYRLPRASQVELVVYDIRGARVATLVDGVEEAGHHDVVLARSTDHGRLMSGIYLVELRAGGEHRTAKIVLTD